MRVGLRAARAVRRAAVWFAAAHFGVHSGASVELAVAAPAVAVALRAELPVPLVARLFVPEFAGYFPRWVLARGRDDPARTQHRWRRSAT